MNGAAGEWFTAEDKARVNDGWRRLRAAFEGLAFDGMGSERAMTRIVSVLNRHKAAFESSLTFGEMKRYLRLQDKRPDLGFYAVAVLVRPN